MTDGFVSVTLLYSDFYQHYNTEMKVGLQHSILHQMLA
jgi:hypothetical protein